MEASMVSGNELCDVLAFFTVAAMNADQLIG